MSKIVSALHPESGRTASPCEVFPTWRRAQLEVDRLAREAPLSPCVLRTTGFLRSELAERVADWFTGKPTASPDAVRRSYRALERETARLFETVRRAPSLGGLGVRVRYVRTESDPYGDAAELCAELREHGSMTLTTIAREEPHPLLGGEQGGVVDQLQSSMTSSATRRSESGSTCSPSSPRGCSAGRCFPPTRAAPRSASSSER